MYHRRRFNRFDECHSNNKVTYCTERKTSSRASFTCCNCWSDTQTDTKRSMVPVICPKNDLIDNRRNESKIKERYSLFRAPPAFQAFFEFPHFWHKNPDCIWHFFMNEWNYYYVVNLIWYDWRTYLHSFDVPVAVQTPVFSCLRSVCVYEVNRFTDVHLEWRTNEER